VLVDAVLTRGLGEVFADVVAVGNVLGAPPGLIREAQREDVAVGADAGIPEEVPGTADAFPPLQHRVRQPGILLMDAVRGTDPRNPRADDEHVGVFAQLVYTLFAQALIGHPQPPLVRLGTTIWLRARARR
jgi:hypothetical protein